MTLLLSTSLVSEAIAMFGELGPRGNGGSDGSPNGK
jgi:hypothetical protein